MGLPHVPNSNILASINRTEENQELKVPGPYLEIRAVNPIQTHHDSTELTDNKPFHQLVEIHHKRL